MIEKLLKHAEIPYISLDEIQIITGNQKGEAKFELITTFQDLITKGLLKGFIGSLLKTVKFKENIPSPVNHNHQTSSSNVISPFYDIDTTLTSNFFMAFSKIVFIF